MGACTKLICNYLHVHIKDRCVHLFMRQVGTRRSILLHPHTHTGVSISLLRTSKRAHINTDMRCTNYVMK